MIKPNQPAEGGRKIYVFNVCMAMLGFITLAYFITCGVVKATPEGIAVSAMIGAITGIAMTFNWSNAIEHKAKGSNND